MAIPDIINAHTAMSPLSSASGDARPSEQGFFKRTAQVKSRRKLGFVDGHVDDTFFEPLPGAELGVWGGR